MIFGGGHQPNNPVLGTPTISRKSSTSCPLGSPSTATKDRMQADWSLSGFDSNYFTLQTGISGGSFSGLTNVSNIHSEWNAPGSSLADQNPTTVAWVFTVTIVRKSDGAIVQQKSSATWNDTFWANCSGIA